MRLRGCLKRSGVFVFSTTPWRVKKITSPPSGVKKEKDTEEKWGWMGVHVSQLNA